MYTQNNFYRAEEILNGLIRIQTEFMRKLLIDLKTGEHDLREFWVKVGRERETDYYKTG